MAASGVAGRHEYNGAYSGEYLSQVAFPMGGIGAGMICLEGTGALSHVSLRHAPEVFNEPAVFSALYLKGAATARVLEGPVPPRKVFGAAGTGNGGGGKTYGLPRFRSASFLARFPFGTVSLEDPQMPVRVALTGWSPFVPGDADSSSLPVCALEYEFVNTSDGPLEAVYSFHADNFMRTGKGSGAFVEGLESGFVLRQPPAEGEPWREGSFAAFTRGEVVSVDCAWFRGGWFDPLTMIWKSVAGGEIVSRAPHREGNPGNGASLYVPFSLRRGESKRILLLLAWYVPASDVRAGWKSADCACGEDGACGPPGSYEPWYAGRFGGIREVVEFWKARYEALRDRTRSFTECFYDSTLPPVVLEAVAANLTILKSPTVLRQKDGRLWAWEGCCDARGCCHGSCTHVWNYAQAMCHLFPSLERSLRETELTENQDDRGHQNFRARLPIGPVDHGFHAAADGQLGGVMKLFREWRISGDTEWMKRLWPKVKQSLGYCIETWDPGRKGILEEPHHNTYDIEFWGPDGMCSSFYLGALRAAALLGAAAGDDVSEYEGLYTKGREYLERELYDGEYFVQRIQWKGLRAPDPAEVKVGIGMNYSPEARALLDAEGPKYQYGAGCLADGVLGAWLAAACGVGEILDPAKVERHVVSVHRYNYRRDLSGHANPQRSTYALGAEGGLLLCSWPKGRQPSLPFVYSNEVWTGIEYQVASHLMMAGHVEEGIEIVRTARNRHDGRVRNPFNEYECGHWYARAMSSYALLEALTGVRYDAVEKVLTIRPRLRGDFRTFLATATGFATVGLKKGEPFVDVKGGKLDVARVEVT